MKIKELLNGIEYVGNENIQVKNLCSDSRKVNSGDLYFAIPGSTFDGHNFCKAALEKGACAVVVQRDLGLQNQIIVEDSRLAYSLSWSNLYNNPAKDLKMIGVTGTNGKTTVTYLIRDMLRTMGKKVAMIGTIEIDIDGTVIPSKHTTPDPWQFFNLLDRIKNMGCEYVVTEVSSQGLDQKRTANVLFEVGVFLNLSEEHLDYHKDMENYYQAKKLLITNSKKAITNIDDKYGKRIKEECKNSLGFSKIEKTDFSFSFSNQDFTLIENKGHISMPGIFSQYNCMAAISTLLALGFNEKDVVSAISKTGGVPGRMETIVDDKFLIIRDFAHTPIAIENALKTLKPYAKNRLIILFGCPGERDKSKRPKMVENALKYADIIIISSDNPRQEDENEILKDALEGLNDTKKKYYIELDRFKAIKLALSMLEPNDLLLLAGKGHEDYQVLNGKTINFNEKEIVKELLK